MLSKEQVHRIRNEIFNQRGPLLSLYADVNPSRPENAGRAWLTRVKNTLRDLEMPSDVRNRCINMLHEEGRPEARTLVLFASEEFQQRLDLQCDLPVVDLAHGRVEARWGEPYLAPLAYALDEFERTGLLWIRWPDWRIYEIFLGEIEDISSWFEAISPQDWRELERYSREHGEEAAEPALYKDRDRFARRMESWAVRFLKRIAHLTEHVVSERAIHRLVLLGRQEATKEFERYLSRSMRKRVIAHVSDTPHPEASPRQVLEKVQPVVEEIERAEEVALVQAVRSQPGVWGLDPTLKALQEGRVEVLLSPWSPGVHIWRCSHGWTAGSRETLRFFCESCEPVESPLRDHVVELSAAHGTRLEFVRGPAEQMLVQELGGLAGLLRW